MPLHQVSMHAFHHTQGHLTSKPTCRCCKQLISKGRNVMAHPERSKDLRLTS